MRHTLLQTGLFCIGAWLCAAQAACAAEVTVDFSKTNGVIRPLHGVNFGPLCYRGMVDLSDYHRELGIPYTRLHDTVWVNAEAVDIHTVFPDFRNNPSDASNYRFLATDDYLEAVVKAGSKIVYRLGESIEHTRRKYFVHPPQDPHKWAEICLGIIRHYNEGWANGFKHGITYWEIWNEPENQPQMWTGSDEDYFRLYEITAKAIKKSYPGLKVGGPSLGATGEFQEGTFKPSAFMLRFLEHCSRTGAPLDFFSWHRYSKDPGEYARRAREMRRILDEHGYKQTESHLNEWNYLPQEDWTPVSLAGQGSLRERCFAEMSGPKGAAFCAWTLISLQNAPVDVANFYTGDIQGFGLFSFNGVPQKNYYGFKAFRKLLDTPRLVAQSAQNGAKVAWCAGMNAERTQVGILVANFDSPDERMKFRLSNLNWSKGVRCEVYRVDASLNLALDGQSDLSANNTECEVNASRPSVVLLKLFPHP